MYIRQSIRIGSYSLGTVVAVSRTEMLVTLRQFEALDFALPLAASSASS